MMDKDSNTTQYKPRVKSWLLLLAFGFIVLTLSILVVMYWVSHKPTRPERHVKQQLAFVEVVPALVSDNVVKISANGFVSAKNTANITPQVSGKIIALSPLLTVGSRVQKGEILAQLEETDYQVALSKANANLSGSKAGLMKAKAALVNAQSTYEQAKAKSRQAARDVKNLGLKGTDLNLKKPQVAAAKSYVDDAKAAIKSAQSAIESAQAQLILAKKNVKRTAITAPFDAIVQKSDVSIGEIANNATLIAQLSSVDTYTVTLTFNNDTMKLLNVGDPILIVEPIYGQRYHAQLSRFATELNANRTLAAYVDIERPLDLNSKPLLLNSYVNATIEGNIISNSLYIPSSAIVNNRFVWGKSDDDTIHQIPVEVIYRKGTETLVKLQTPTDSIITRPKEEFIEGQQVSTSNTNTINKTVRKSKTSKHTDTQSNDDDEQKPSQESKKAQSSKPSS